MDNLNSDLATGYSDHWHSRKGFEYYQAGNYELAIEESLKAVSILEDGSFYDGRLSGPEGQQLKTKQYLQTVNQGPPRVVLLDSYEKLGLHEKALEQADWLIKHQKFESKRQIYIDRRTALLKSVRNADDFYSVLRSALDEKKKGDYEKAIQLFNDALANVKLGPEIVMVHHQLALIYREQGNAKLELQSLKEAAKYTANPDARAEDMRRIDELQKDNQ